MLKEGVKSVICQDYENLEIIIVNDGSSDDTEEVIKDLKRQDPRMISSKNDRPRGPSAARNKGIEKARGEFIAFLDDDDKWLPARVSDGLKFLKHYDASLCESTDRSHQSPLYRGKGRGGLICINNFKRGSFAGLPSLMGYSYVFKNVRFDENLFIGEDWDIFIRIASKYKMGFQNKALVTHNQGEHDRLSQIGTINMPIEKIEKRLSIAYKHKEFFGPFWFNYHVAKRLLAYIKYRDNKYRQIFYSIRRCGVKAVLAVFCMKVYRNADGLFRMDK